MKKLGYDWITYWRNNNIFQDDSARRSMEIFIKHTTPILNYNKRDIVLDIGCGTGYLAYLLKDVVKEIHCLDVSERYLNICEERFIRESNIYIEKLDNCYTDLSMLQNKRFSLIICKSVVQYYRDIDEVDDLIDNVRGIASPGARFLIADIPGPGHLAELWNDIKAHFLCGTLKEFLTFLYRARTSDYYRIRSEVGLLAFSEEELNHLIDRKKLNAKILKNQLTESPNRKHLLIMM